jgi:hypothetical protein
MLVHSQEQLAIRIPEISGKMLLLSTNSADQAMVFRCTIHKGVGPNATLAWPGWKQSDIAVEVDTERLETSRFKKCCANCVLLYFPCTEFKSAFNVY